MYQLDFEIFGYSIHTYVNNSTFIEDYGKQIDTQLDFNILESISKYLKKDKNE